MKAIPPTAGLAAISYVIAAGAAHAHTGIGSASGNRPITFGRSEADAIEVGPEGYH